MATEVSLLGISVIDATLATRLAKLLNSPGSRDALSVMSLDLNPDVAEQARTALSSVFDYDASPQDLYNRIRDEMPSGRDRTVAMTQIVAEVRSLVRQGQLKPNEVPELWKQGEGGRIAAIAIQQERPDPANFSLVLSAVQNSRSAFEQYQGLLALDAMVPKMNADQRRQTVETIKDQQTQGPGKYIRRNSDRWPLAERILAKISAVPE
jgi:hypothetical protein